MNNSIYLGNGKMHYPKESLLLKELNLEGELYFKIENIDALPPFFISVVSNSNHWMFISSNGALSAGRKNSDHALFPYYTDDKITESGEHTGSKTIFLVSKENKKYLWEPFSQRQTGNYSIERNLYKNGYGNKIIFEEINLDLNLIFSYSWNTSDKYGFIRTAKLTNTGDNDRFVELVDGLQNLLPYGVGEDLQKASSNLVDAYKKSELSTKTGMGIYSLSAIIVDRAEPSEALKANAVWSTGLNNASRLLSSTQLDDFRFGKTPVQETDIRAKRGAYFLSSSMTLNSGEENTWRIIADVNKTISSLIALESQISNDQIVLDLQQDIDYGTEELLKLVGAVDGLQLSQDSRGNVRHFANTMFNIMRGGIFDDNYFIEKSDFLPYIKKANSYVYSENETVLLSLSIRFSLNDLFALIKTTDNSDFSRLCFEYLPLKFSRRHGDPSRPWNKFSINTKNEIDGSKVLYYQGNWRDIFQNWEALAHAYPLFIQGMIHKFLNATTFDGYNPYRVTKDGFDWETIEPDNPWAYIGYWGDHQIIYLLKFLEFSEKHFPSQLTTYFSQESFVYANVPYRIKDYSSIIQDPKNTIDYDIKEAQRIAHKKKLMGADGALLFNARDEVCRVNFIEKILASLMAKLSNFVPEAGIWMNTQRPEWNDANNALVGNGVSMVTLYYLRRFLSFFSKILYNSESDTYAISNELKVFFDRLHTAFDEHQGLIGKTISNQKRKAMMDVLGIAASDYRNQIYAKGFTGKKTSLKKSNLLGFLNLSLAFLDDAIRKNKREDGLYHAYNLITIDNENEVSLNFLAEMLEGQVAVLSAGHLSNQENLSVLDALRKSKLYREDQESYTLYPNKDLGVFMKKNTLSEEAVKRSQLLQALVKADNRQLITMDIKGKCHFNGNFKNAYDLKRAITELPEEFDSLIAKEEDLILSIFEEVFKHKEFTGRSGTFFGYEGLGSIYWHMVSKLSLAVCEVTLAAKGTSEFNSLKKHYYEIVKGIGAHKTPEAYGAFPSDPYSHTPAGKGAQQPGMTGQVKEDILTRFGELGVQINEGQLLFDPSLLKPEEFLSTPKTFTYFNVAGEKKELHLEKNCLAFTYCQVPIIYKKGSSLSLEVEYHNTKPVKIKGNALTIEMTKALFHRTNDIVLINVEIA